MSKELRQEFEKQTNNYLFEFKGHGQTLMWWKLYCKWLETRIDQSTGWISVENGLSGDQIESLCKGFVKKYQCKDADDWMKKHEAVLIILFKHFYTEMVQYTVPNNPKKKSQTISHPKALHPANM